MSRTVRQKNVYCRKKESGFREKPVLSFYSQPFLHRIDGKLRPRGRGPQVTLSPQLGSYGHIVEGVSRLGGQGVLRSWRRQGKAGCRLKGNRMPSGQCGRGDFIPCLSGMKGCHSGPYFNDSSEPLESPNTGSRPQQGPAPLLTEAWLASHCGSALSLPET